MHLLPPESWLPLPHFLLVDSLIQVGSPHPRRRAWYSGSCTFSSVQFINPIDQLCSWAGAWWKSAFLGKRRVWVKESTLWGVEERKVASLLRQRLGYRGRFGSSWQVAGSPNSWLLSSRVSAGKDACQMNTPTPSPQMHRNLSCQIRFSNQR